MGFNRSLKKTMYLAELYIRRQSYESQKMDMFGVYKGRIKGIFGRLVKNEDNSSTPAL